MISVLIATVFIAIIATTLLYMAYLNFLTKSVRNASNDNFYTCEYALDDLATSLQQIAAEQDSPDTAISKITYACTGSAVSVSGRYDGAKVASILKIANQLADISVSSNVPVGTNNYIVSANSITLKGLVITSESKDDADPYKATITTDLTLTFNSSSEGGMDVNDFSVIGDDTINWSGGGVMVMAGNIFMRSRGWLEEHVTYDASEPNKGIVDNYFDDTTANKNEYSLKPQTNAIVCGDISGSGTNGDVLSLTGDRGIIVGNVVVASGGLLTITGNINVIGNIYVVGGGTLMCSGNLQCSGNVFVSPGSIIKGVDDVANIINRSMNISFLVDKDKAGTGICSNLFEKFYIVYPNSSGKTVVAPFSGELERQVHINDGDADSCSKGYETCTTLGYMRHVLICNPDIDNHKDLQTSGGINVAINSDNTLNASSSFGGRPTLFFNFRNGYSGNGHRLEVQTSLGDTTMMSIGPIYNTGTYQNGIRMSHMSDEAYAYAKTMLLPLKSPSFSNLLDVRELKIDGTLGNEVSDITPNVTLSFASGLSDGEMQTIIDNYKNGTLGADQYVYEYTVGVGTSKEEKRYAVYNSGKLYLPAGYLIRPDAGEYITQIFNSISSEVSPTNTNITYDNWKKNDA